MENTSDTGVVQNDFDGIGGIYAPENSHVPPHRLNGLTLPSYEQCDDQNLLGFQDDDSLWGSFSMEEDTQRNSSVNSAALFLRTNNFDDLFADAPKCPDDYIEPEVAKRRKFNSDSTTASSSYALDTPEITSPITESLSVFSQQVIPKRKTTEQTPSSNTTPKVTSETSQQATGKELLLSQVSSSGMNNSSNSDLPITPFNGQDTDLQTPPIFNPVSLNNRLSQSFTDPMATPEVVQASSAADLISMPEHQQMVQQQTRRVTSAPLPIMSQTPQIQAASNVYGHQLSPEQPRSQRKPFTAFPPAQNLGYTPFKRPHKYQSTSPPHGSVQSIQLPTQHATGLQPPSRPIPSTAPQQPQPRRLNRNSIKPQLREVMERFEEKIRTDADLRRAFNIVFPGKSTNTQFIIKILLISITARNIEVEELKQIILNERRQAAIKENILKKMIQEFKDAATAQEALQTRAMGVLAELRADPTQDRSWVCLNYNKNGVLCNNIHKEFHLLNKVWKRRERCSKCKTKTPEQNRMYLDGEAAVSSLNFEKVTPAMSDITHSLKRTRDELDKPAVTPTFSVDPNRRQSLPTLIDAGQRPQQDTSSRWASLPPPTKMKSRDHTPLNNTQSTQNALRAALGTKPKSWMQPPKEIETIILDDDSDEEVDTDKPEEDSDKSPAAEPEATTVENSMEADFEADFEAQFEADLEADLIAALEEELA